MRDEIILKSLKDLKWAYDKLVRAGRIIVNETQREYIRLKRQHEEDKNKNQNTNNA